MRSATSVSMERNLSATGHTLDYNIEKLQALSAGSANAMAAAFESFKVFQPELSRLSGKTVELRQGIEDIHPLIRSLQVPGAHFKFLRTMLSQCHALADTPCRLRWTAMRQQPPSA